MANIDKKIEKAIEPIVKMYSELETELLIKIAEHFKINEEFINSDYWRIAKLNEMGAFNSEVIDFIAKYTKHSRNEIKKALQKVYIDTLDLDTLRSAYKNNQIRINPKEILNSPLMMTMVNNAYSDMSNRFIQMSNRIENATRQAYLDIVEKEYLATSTGIKSYGESIRESLNELANKGIDTLDYVYEKDGVQNIRHYDIEGAVRREILTGARQLSGHINIELIKETECEYVKFSEHLDCRPTHFDWQGTIVEASEWETIADYGDVAGIYGINCRHYVEPYFGDHKGNEEKKLTQEQCDEAYRISQKQRYLERGVRAWKRKSMMSKVQGDTYEYKKAILKTHEWQKKSEEFNNLHNRTRKYDNEYVSGFKDATVNLIPPKSVVNKLSSVNIVADDSLGKIPTDLLQRNVNQYKKLTEKYDMQDFYKEQGAIYLSPDTKKYIGAISYNDEMTYIKINSSYQYFYDRKDMINTMKKHIEIGEFMPCDEKNYDIYAMTHEFGHTLEMKMFKNKYPNGNNIKYSYFCSDVKNDIISIALEKNPNIDLRTAISAYGHDIKTQEFFAEAFANMELGKPNEIGKAMKEYLKREGIR